MIVMMALMVEMLMMVMMAMMVMNVMMVMMVMMVQWCAAASGLLALGWRRLPHCTHQNPQCSLLFQQVFYLVDFVLRNSS